MKKILVVGQTPPPHGGQAIMIENMLKAKFTQVKLYHVRMAFSSDMDEVGKFKLMKIVRLLELIIKIYFYRFAYNIHTLYYPPAPPLRVPVMRDILILNSTRWLFKKTIFHFHAAGVSEMYPQMKGLLKKLYERAYFQPDVCIRLSEFNPEDGKQFNTKKECIVPNGLDDMAALYPWEKKEEIVPQLLSVGVLCESKGVMVLLEAAAILHKRGHNFMLKFMGRFESEVFRKRIQDFIKEQELSKCIEFLGVQTGIQKHDAFSKADLFCFPTFFEAETFGLVALEAMQFNLPVVASRWRGIPSVVQDGVNGLLVPPKDAKALAEKLEILILDPALRKSMGEEGRKIYEEKFTAEEHYKQLEQAFVIA